MDCLCPLSNLKSLVISLEPMLTPEETPFTFELWNLIISLFKNVELFRYVK